MDMRSHFLSARMDCRGYFPKGELLRLRNFLEAICGRILGRPRGWRIDIGLPRLSDCNDEDSMIILNGMRFVEPKYLRAC
jgi:hypothetical protein